MLSVLLLLGGLAPALPAGPHWTYEGPHGQQHWHEGHPACGGRAQSPIDIATARAQPDPSLPPLRPEGYERPESARLTLANNGHTAVLALPPSLRLRGLPRTFAALQLHFHWGRPGRAAGAEHLLDGHRAPAEMHVVHFDVERFADASAAQQHPGGLAVLGVLLEVGDDPHPAYDNILRHLGSIRYADGGHPLLQHPGPAARAPGALLPLQRVPDHAALLPERPLDPLPAARPHQPGPAGAAPGKPLLHGGGRAGGAPAPGGQFPGPAGAEPAPGALVLPQGATGIFHR
ncbi:carbonic anhydrase 14 isoform X2 [Vidua macroura]|uniref:carbonic anhydrase 14 isoform X2 n=1 Tax=Vidua macroura TaxID=187451 RepID=UPI0023A7A7CE|nr:carbonic anhydrase 14 isoform X2 [Vidua macroura]